MGQEGELLEVPMLRMTNRPQTSDDLQALDVRPPPDDRRFHTRAKTHGHPMPDGRPTPGRRPDVRPKITRAESADVRQAPDVWTFASLRTTGDSWTSDACTLFRVESQPMYPFAPLFCTKTIYRPPIPSS